MTYWVKPRPGFEAATKLFSGQCECWDTTPPDLTGWREAVEIKPDLIPDEQHHGAHYFDMSTSPAQIVWEKHDYTPEEKASIKAQRVTQANKVVQDQLDAIDKKKVRAMTDATLSGDKTRLAQLESDAAALRKQLVSSV